MTPTEYRDRTQRRLTLPSGIAVTVRSLSYADLMALRDTIPNEFLSLSAEEQQKHEQGAKWSARMMLYTLTHCVTSGLRIVDSETPKDDELSVYELTNEDAQAISAAVHDATAKGGPPSAVTFPQPA